MRPKSPLRTISLILFLALAAPGHVLAAPNSKDLVPPGWESGPAWVETTRVALLGAGLRLGSWKELPKIEGQVQSEPKNIDQYDAAMAEGFVMALLAVKGTTLGAPKDFGSTGKKLGFDPATAMVLRAPSRLKREDDDHDGARKNLLRGEHRL